MRSTTPTLPASSEMSIWQMAIRLTLLASLFVGSGYGVLYAVKSMIRLLA